ncbi:MAG TPA: RsmB/NOP family class I SAM-dependent RNA methyltransferase [Burkholderiales bacterium]|nr:RsmB/NOP family class I SAM-dependent RNA methyltransferase [Burkholderiales bacterium]
MNLTRPLLGQASAALAQLLDFSGPADEVLSRFFREHRSLGRQDRAFIAESVFAVLRRKRSLGAASGSQEPRALLVAALVRVLGFSGRSLEGLLKPDEFALVSKAKAFRLEGQPPAVRADLPDWLWARLAAEHGDDEATRIAQAMLNPAPLDLRVNLARTGRDEMVARLAADGLPGEPTPYSPAGIRLPGKPAINRHPAFLEGLVEVQDEGSQLLAWLLAPRRGEMVADYCAGAGGKTLAIAMLMRGSGRLYAMDISGRRLAALAPRAARAGVTSIHPVTLSGDNDPRVKRLAGKMDRVLVDAPCSGFGTLRRNPDLKWRHTPAAVEELAQKQARILKAAARLVKPGGRLVYATCSLLQQENDAIADSFSAASPEFAPLSCADLLRGQRITLESGDRLRLLPHRHGTDGFFAAAFERRG